MAVTLIARASNDIQHVVFGYHSVERLEPYVCSGLEYTYSILRICGCGFAASSLCWNGCPAVVASHGTVFTLWSCELEAAVYLCVVLHIFHHNCGSPMRMVKKSHGLETNDPCLWL